jgi:hypothetical protein
MTTLLAVAVALVPTGDGAQPPPRADGPDSRRGLGGAGSMTTRWSVRPPSHLDVPPEAGSAVSHEEDVGIRPPGHRAGAARSASAGRSAHRMITRPAVGAQCGQARPPSPGLARTPPGACRWPPPGATCSTHPCRPACSDPCSPVDSPSWTLRAMTREEYPTPRCRWPRGTSSQRAGAAASRYEDGGEWTREPGTVRSRAARTERVEDGWHRGRTDLPSRLYRRATARADGPAPIAGATLRAPRTTRP